MDAEKASVIERLEAYNQRFENLLDLLKGSLPLAGEARAEAQSQLKELKADLEREYKQMSTVKGNAELSDIERSCYAPVIHQVFADIHVAWNSVPNDKWHGNLYGAQISLTHMLHQLRR